MLMKVIGIDPDIFGVRRYGMFRYGVYNSIFDDTIARLEAYDASNIFTEIINNLERGGINSPSYNVTLRTLSLGAHGSRDSWTGWRTKSWSESTIKMGIIKGGATRMALLAGVYPSINTRGICLDGIKVGDQIKDSNDDYWDVETVEDVPAGDDLAYRECLLNKAKLYQADFGATTWSKTRPQDARYRTKDWMDSYLRAAQITKDDDSTLADCAVIFNNPPYSLELEFRHDTTPVQGLFVIDQPNSTPLRSGDQIIRNYEDHVPIHIMTVDSTGCTGTALQHKMTAELQYICQEHPTGSQRNLERRSTSDRDLGGMWLYDTEYTLSYTRSAST